MQQGRGDCQSYFHRPLVFTHNKQQSPNELVQYQSYSIIAKPTNIVNLHRFTQNNNGDRNIRENCVPAEMKSPKANRANDSLPGATLNIVRTAIK